jgi:tetratricopeptide (TPR) repeat protein
MRALIGWTCALALTTGCGKKTDTQPAAGSGSAPAPVATAPADASAIAIPPGEYEGHMKAGEALEDAKDWARALEEFESALVAKPGDARALNEIGFNATFAGKLDRAKEAGIAAIAAAKDNKTLHAQALLNLGLAVEKSLPYASAALYRASLAERPNAAVNARLTKLEKNKAASEQSKPALALLSQVGVDATTKAPAAKSSATAEDQALMTALEDAGVEWQSGAGKSVLLVENVECRENHQPKIPTYECTVPAIKGKPAHAIISALGMRKIAPVKDHGDISTFKVATVRCRSLNEGDSGAADSCEVTP